MKENFGKLGIEDFFNVLFAGGIFIVGIWWTFPFLFELYDDFKWNYEVEAYVGIIVIIFLLGLVAQELGTSLDQRWGHIKSNVIENFLRKKENVEIKKPRIIRLVDSILRIDRVEKGIKKSNFILANDMKFNLYRKYGECIFIMVRRIQTKF